MAGDWQVEFFKDPRTGRVPAREFLEQIPDKPAAELLATLQAVEGTRPPFAFRGGARWQAMSGDMNGWFEGPRHPAHRAMSADNADNQPSRS